MCRIKLRLLHELRRYGIHGHVYTFQDSSEPKRVHPLGTYILSFYLTCILSDLPGYVRSTLVTILDILVTIIDTLVTITLIN